MSTFLQWPSLRGHNFLSWPTFHTLTLIETSLQWTPFDNSSGQLNVSLTSNENSPSVKATIRLQSYSFVLANVPDIYCYQNLPSPAVDTWQQQQPVKCIFNLQNNLFVMATITLHSHNFWSQPTFQTFYSYWNLPSPAADNWKQQRPVKCMLNLQDNLFVVATITLKCCSFWCQPMFHTFTLIATFPALQ